MDCCVVVFFFFKQKTAYEMRISDWSSDVCSSDLLADPMLGAADEDDDLMLQPFGQQLVQSHDLWRARRVEDVEVEREAVFQIGQPEQAFLQYIGVDIAALGHQHDAQDRKSTRLNSSH